MAGVATSGAGESGPVGLGLAGCGRISRLVHLGVLTRLSGARLVALADVDGSALEAARQAAPGAVALAGCEELVERADVDAVIVCLPSGLHGAAAVAALEAGKHVYVEKPLAAKLEEGREILAVWKRAQLIGMIGFNFRFHPLFRAARDALAAGRIGEPVAARTTFCSGSSDLPAWKERRASGGGALLDLASHHADLVRFVLGREVEEVIATIGSRRSEHDLASLELRLEGGVVAQTFVSLVGAAEDRLEVYGEEGKLVVDRYRSLAIELSRGPASTRLRRLVDGVRPLASGLHGVRTLAAPTREPSYETALARFVACVRNGEPASPDLLDGFRSLAVVAAAEASASARPTVAVAPEPA